MAYMGQLPSWIQRIPHFDWLMHFLLLGGLGFGLHKTLREKNFRFQRWLLPIGPCVVSVWSVLDESMQLFSPNRVFSPADMIANLLGIWLFFVVNVQLQKRKAVL